MRPVWTGLATALALAAIPTTAMGAETSGAQVPVALTTGVGVVALALAAGLLVQMLALRRIAEGAAIADNIAHAVFAIICLAASVLVGWISRFMPTGFSVDQARLGADLLAVASMSFFGVYFWRVRRAMSRFLSRLTGEEQLLASALDPAAEETAPDE